MGAHLRAARHRARSGAGRERRSPREHDRGRGRHGVDRKWRGEEHHDSPQVFDVPPEGDYDDQQLDQHDERVHRIGNERELERHVRHERLLERLGGHERHVGYERELERHVGYERELERVVGFVRHERHLERRLGHERQRLGEHRLVGVGIVRLVLEQRLLGLLERGVRRDDESIVSTLDVMTEPEITFRRTASGFVVQDATALAREAATGPGPEASDSFPCFGTTCAAYVIGDTPQRTNVEAVELARTVLLEWHRGFSRFEPDSELSRLNADPRETVPVSSTMARFVAAACDAARLTGGLVDPTLASEIEAAGYAGDLPEAAQSALDLRATLAQAPARAPGRPSATSAWGSVQLDSSGTAVTRPVGVRLDSGGIAKGLFADLLVAALREHESVAINCGGDLRLGGRGGLTRAVEVSSPFGPGTLHVFELAAGGAATSGIGKRSWIDSDGRPAHHLLDPATGRPAFTGVVQVTALAPSAAEAEARAKAALLSGPDGAIEWLPHGGVVVYDDERHEVIEPLGPDAVRPAR